VGAYAIARAQYKKDDNNSQVVCVLFFLIRGNFLAHGWF
jgi:hypothetical protein